MAATTRWVSLVAVISGLMAGAERSARADLIIGNLDPSSISYGEKAVFNPEPYAMGFTTGNAAVTVGIAQLELTYYVIGTMGTPTAAQWAQLTLGIYTNSGSNQPTAETPSSVEVGTFSLTSYPAGTSGLVTFTGSSVILAANTTYWLVLGKASNSDDLFWDYTTANAENTYPKGETPTGPAGGATNFSTPMEYEPNNSPPGWSSVNAGGYLASYALYTTPEPSTLVMVSITSLIGLAVSRRRRSAAEPGSSHSPK